MHSRDQNIFIVRTVENSKLPFFGQGQIMTPQIIVLQLGRIRRFKTVNHHAAGIEFFKHFPNQTVFPAGIHALQTNQKRMSVVSIHRILLLAELHLNLIQSQFLFVFIGFNSQSGWNFRQINLYQLHI